VLIADDLLVGQQSVFQQVIGLLRGNGQSRRTREVLRNVKRVILSGLRYGCESKIDGDSCMKAKTRLMMPDLRCLARCKSYASPA
jgi:hypothetical protein